MSDEDKSNQCPICLESLAVQGPIVATVPCGHCFHSHCWDAWAASRLAGGTRNPKCGLCNNPTRSACRLFLELEKLGEGSNGVDEDDSSISSDEEDDDEEKLEEEKEKEDSTLETEEEQATASETKESEEVQDEDTATGGDAGTSNTTTETNNNLTAEVIVLDDDNDVQVVEQPAQPSSQPSNRRKRMRKEEASSSSEKETDQEPSNKTKKYKRFAKVFQRKCRMLQSQKEQHAKEQQLMRSKLENARTELKETRAEWEDFEDAIQEMRLDLEGARLKTVRLDREREEAQRKYKDASTRLNVVENQLANFQARHKKELERARATSLAEVDQIIKEYPKVNAERHALKEKVALLQKELSKLGAPLDNNTSAKRAAPKTLKKKDMLKQLGQVLPRNKQSSQRTHEDREQAQQCLQKSSRARELRRAMQPQQQQLSRRSTLDLLASTGNKKQAPRNRSAALVHRSQKHSAVPQFRSGSQQTMTRFGTFK